MKVIYIIILCSSVIGCIMLSPIYLTSMLNIKKCQIKIILYILWGLLFIFTIVTAYTLAKKHYELHNTQVGATSSFLENGIFIILFLIALIFMSPWALKRLIKKEIPNRGKLFFWIIRICLVCSILILLISLFL